MSSVLGHTETFIDKVSSAKTIDAVFDALREQVDRLGFAHFCYYLIRPPQEGMGGVVISSYPHDWRVRYRERCYAKHDLALISANESLLPVDWDKLKKNPRITSTQTLIFTEAASVGIRSGGTVSIRGPGHGLASFSVSTAQDDGSFAKLWAEYRHEVHLMATYAHEKIMSILLSQPQNRDKVVRLSQREKECLLWAARGKTNWETAAILGITSNTVSEHIRHITRKMGVYHKTHAVARAIMDGLIAP